MVRAELEAWSLGALEPAEMAAIEQHLAGCADCRREADTFAQVVSMLPLALSPVSPSTATKRRLMDRIAEDQLATSTPARSTGAPHGSSTGIDRIESRRSFHWSQVLIAPLAIALLVVSLWAFQLQRQVNESDGSGDTVNMTMLPEGFQAFSMEAECEKCSSTGKLLADPAKADALMVAWNLDPSEIHEVWCEERDGERVLVASFEVSENGDVVQPLVFDQPIAGYSKIYVTNADGETVEIRLDPPDEVPASPSPSAT